MYHSPADPRPRTFSTQEILRLGDPRAGDHVYNRESTFPSQIAPCIYQDFERHPPKWFSAITCAIWLRLIFRGRGSAWFFGAHLLFFHARGRILEPRIGFWIPRIRFRIPRSTFWPGALFGTKKWSRKKLFCGGMILWWGFRGIRPAQMNSMVPRSHMGRPLCPKYYKKWF